MPGGPVNGADKNITNVYTGIVIPTVLQMATDALNYWTSMTCLYDRYWMPDTNTATLPICMFHVTKITPTYTVETSKKRIILYEPQGDEKLSAKEMSNQLRENVMRSVIDNSVKMPTTYTVEAIVPFQPIGRYITEGVKAVSDMIAGFSELVGIGYSHIGESAFSAVFASLKGVGTAVETAGRLPGMDGVSYINMNSLEAMAVSCRTLCMKMWTGYNYKYVQITNMTYEKHGKEDDVFRVTMTLQEKPVLAVSRPRTMTPHTKKGFMDFVVMGISIGHGASVTPLIGTSKVPWLTGVKKAAGSGASDASLIEKLVGD